MPRRFLLLAVYSAVTVVMAAPLCNYGALGTASYTGDARLIIWTLAWDNHAVLTGHPLFDSNIFYPAPHSLAYNEHLFGLSLFTLPVYGASGNPVLAYNAVWLLSFVLSALAGHALARRCTDSDIAAAAGSLVITFSFYRMLHAHGHLHLVWTWLMPLSIVLLERWRERPSPGRALLWAGAVVLQALTSWYLAVMVVLLQAIALCTILPALYRERRVAAVWHLVVGTLLGAAVIVPFVLPYRALAPAARSEVASNAADIAAYLVPPENTWIGQLWLQWIGAGPRWIWGERTLFIGWLALALAALGVWHLWRVRRWRTLALFGTLTVIAFLLSLGPALQDGAFVDPYSLLARVPGMGGFRAPARFALLVVLGTGGLAAAGAQVIVDRWRHGALIVLGLIPFMLSEWFVVRFPVGRPQPFAIPPIYFTEPVRSARAIVSVPEYRGTPDWPFGADYLYFSTAHWRPIVNGFGRAEPPGHARNISHMMAFPGPNNARSMRSLGVEYVVFHADRYPGGGRALIDVALHSPDYRLAARVGNDYLFAVVPSAVR